MHGLANQFLTLPSGSQFHQDPHVRESTLPLHSAPPPPPPPHALQSPSPSFLLCSAPPPKLTPVTTTTTSAPPPVRHPPLPLPLPLATAAITAATTTSAVPTLLAMASRLLLPSLAALLLLSLASPTPTATATLHPVDYLALQAVRRALSDLPGSNFFASWDFTGDPCEFSGISCSTSGRVTTLSLGDPRAGAAGLTGRFPSSAIATLSSLTSLSLVPGHVTGSLSPTVTSLPALRFLALSGNLLAGDIPTTFSPTLRTVDLSHNGFTGRIPPSLLGLRDLRTLVLSHNNLAGEIPRAVRAPLVHLDLRSNRLSGGVPPLPGTLVYLSLAGNRLSGQVGTVLRRLNRLSFLDLGRNWFSGEVPGELFAFNRLSYLQLRKNAFSGSVRPSGHVPSGATVDLSHNALSGRVPAELATAGAVYLNGNRFAGEVPREVAAAAEDGRMRVLFLQDNFLTGIAVGGVLPASAAVCAHWNCVEPPPAVVAACPAKGGRGRRRPMTQCRGRRG